MKFRFKALDRRRQPDRLDSPMLLASPRGWVAVFVVMITTVGVLIWAVLGSIPRTTTVDGALGYAGGVVWVQAPVPGTVSEVAKSPGDPVEAGEPVLVLRREDGTELPVPSPAGGRVVAVGSDLGRVVDVGAPLMEVERMEGADEPLQVLFRVDAETVPFIREGQRVSVAVPGVNPRVFGRLEAVVTDVSSYPVDPAPAGPGAGAGGEAGTASGTVIGPHLVTASLTSDSETVSGYGWTSQEGPPITLTSRTPVQGEIELGSVSPISVLIGG